MRKFLFFIAAYAPVMPPKMPPTAQPCNVPKDTTWEIFSKSTKKTKVTGWEAGRNTMEETHRAHSCSERGRQETNNGKRDGVDPVKRILNKANNGEKQQITELVIKAAKERSTWQATEHGPTG